MNGRNALLLRKLFIAILLIIICITSCVYATDVTVGDGDTTEPTEPPVTSTLPHIEMKVKATKVGENNQILLEMWGSNFTNLEAIEFVFTYNNTKLTPSNVSDNNIVENLDLYKYEKRPTQAGDKPTDLELLEQAEFDQNSTDALSKAFSFEDEYKSPLGIDLFRYLAPEGNIEAMQFVMSKKDEASNISATELVLLGKFSFRQTEGTMMDETEFATSRIKVSCDDGVTEGKESYYVRDVENGENCEEIVEFTYEKYGSISGIVEAEISTIGNKKTFSSKNITNIELYESSKVNGINFADKNYRKSLPEQPDIEYKTTEEENGVFKIENINFGNYVVIIDKDNYADWIITNVDINSNNKDIDFSNIIKNGMETQGFIKKEGIISLIPGDIDKNGLIDSNDTLLYNKDYRGQKKIDFNDATSRKGDINDSNDVLAYNAAYSQYKSVGKKTIKVKTIIEL